MSVPMDPQSVTARLRLASELAELRTEHRLDAKLDMSPTGITRRLREVERMRRVCQRLARLPPAT